MAYLPSLSFCSTCLRRALTRPRISIAASQRRGKKKLPKSQTIQVKLLEDVPTFGPRGAIVPVAPGRMRNNWYPRRVADYIVLPEPAGTKTNFAPVTRDFNFQNPAFADEIARDDDPAPSPDSERVRVKVATLSPLRSMQVLSDLLPPSFEFHRSPITQPQDPPSAPKATTSSADPPSSASRSEADVVSATGTPIYGSVSSFDIATSIRSLLATDEEGARVTVSAEDITLHVSADDRAPGAESGQTDRVKTLGEFDVEIQVRGSTLAPIRRKMVVLAR